MTCVDDFWVTTPLGPVKVHLEKVAGHAWNIEIGLHREIIGNVSRSGTKWSAIESSTWATREQAVRFSIVWYLLEVETAYQRE